MPGYSLDPPYKDQECKGIDLTEFGENLVRDFRQVYLFWLIEIYKNYPVKDKFFLPFFDKLAGTASLREMIVAGKTEEEIRASWQADLAAYKKIRKNYLLYPDFE
jgi:uncharacterized protein YbbC (DUF1343 family)